MVVQRSDYCAQDQRPAAVRVSILARAEVSFPAASQLVLENTLTKYWEEREELEPACSCKDPIAQETVAAVVVAAAVVSEVPSAIAEQEGR